MAGSSRCPKCGAEVRVPVKSWVMAPRRRDGAVLQIFLFECPKCFSRWREVAILNRARR